MEVYKSGNKNYATMHYRVRENISKNRMTNGARSIIILTIDHLKVTRNAIQRKLVYIEEIVRFTTLEQLMCLHTLVILNLNRVILGWHLIACILQVDY